MTSRGLVFFNILPIPILLDCPQSALKQQHTFKVDQAKVVTVVEYDSDKSQGLT